VEARIGSLLGVSTAGIAALRTELKDIRSQVCLTVAFVVEIYGSVSGHSHANTGDVILLYFESMHHFRSALVLIRILQIRDIADPDPVCHHIGSKHFLSFFYLEVPYPSTTVRYWENVLFLKKLT
jgi:hypothetical protein